VPRYQYYCNICKKDFIAVHSWKEPQEFCVLCNGVDIKKLLTKPLTPTKKGNPKVGDLTKEFIEANKEVLEELKEATTSENYE